MGWVQYLAAAAEKLKHQELPRRRYTWPPAAFYSALYGQKPGAGHSSYCPQWSSNKCCSLRHWSCLISITECHDTGYWALSFKYRIGVLNLFFFPNVVQYSAAGFTPHKILVRNSRGNGGVCCGAATRQKVVFLAHRLVRR